MWDTSIELVRALILVIAQAMGGSVGGSIALVSFVLRLALIPLSLKVARRMRVRAIHVGLESPVALLR